MSKEYDIWWYEEGSGMCPAKGEDIEEFAHRITRIAWSNGAYTTERALKGENEDESLSRI